MIKGEPYKKEVGKGNRCLLLRSGRQKQQDGGAVIKSSDLGAHLSVRQAVGHVRMELGKEAWDRDNISSVDK